MRKVFLFLLSCSFLVCSKAASAKEARLPNTPFYKAQEDLTLATRFEAIRQISEGEMSAYMSQQRTHGCKVPGGEKPDLALDPKVKVGMDSFAESRYFTPLRTISIDGFFRLIDIVGNKQSTKEQHFKSFVFSDYNGPTVQNSLFSTATCKVITPENDDSENSLTCSSENNPNSLSPELLEKIEEHNQQVSELCYFFYDGQDNQEEVWDGTYTLRSGPVVPAYMLVYNRKGSIKCPNPNNILHGMKALSRIVSVFSNKVISSDFDYCGGVYMANARTLLTPKSKNKNDKIDGVTSLEVYTSSINIQEPVGIRD